MQQPDRRSLRALTLAAGSAGRFIADPVTRVTLAGLRDGSALGVGVDALRGRSVLVSTQAQLPTVLAVLELDGVARRLLLCPPDLAAEHLTAIMAEAEVDGAVTDGAGPTLPALAGLVTVPCRSDLGAPAPLRLAEAVETEWVLFTSGTTGRPKMVRHTLQSLTGHLLDTPAPAGVIWSTFYDVRRYGGLSILVRALLAPASMVLSDAAEPAGRFLERAGAAGVTHISGTPSHWRRALMSPSIRALAPRAVRLSGEIADQAILDQLRTAFPGAAVTHAFASTEAGVAFEVTDGLAGFPAAMLDGHGLAALLRVEDDTLRIRSRRIASGYVGQPVQDPERFVDTGDLVARRGDRFVFTGRREGVINVGARRCSPKKWRP